MVPDFRRAVAYLVASGGTEASTRPFLEVATARLKVILSGEFDAACRSQGVPMDFAPALVLLCDLVQVWQLNTLLFIAFLFHKFRQTAAGPGERHREYIYGGCVHIAAVSSCNFAMSPLSCAAGFRHCAS